MVEPGRSIVGPAGVLLTRVLYRKRNGDKEFMVVDAAMNDLIRPALYRAHHEIVPVRKNALPPVTADVVGPVCETGDFLARDREMANVMPGDFLAVCTAGAYGFVQASNYNSRPRAPEVLVEGDALPGDPPARDVRRTWSAAKSSRFGPPALATSGQKKEQALRPALAVLSKPISYSAETWKVPTKLLRFSRSCHVPPRPSPL